VAQILRPSGLDLACVQETSAGAAGQANLSQEKPPDSALARRVRTVQPGAHATEVRRIRGDQKRERKLEGFRAVAPVHTVNIPHAWPQLKLDPYGSITLPKTDRALPGLPALEEVGNYD
jgi:hypothetical protein